MLEICIPDSKEKIISQIKALKYLLKQDTRKQDKEIHSNALKSLERALEGFK